MCLMAGTYPFCEANPSGHSLVPSQGCRQVGAWGGGQV